MMTPRTKDPLITISKWAGAIAAVLGVLYSLNRPITTFNTLAASVDKLASAVTRLDENQGKQTDRINAQSEGLAALRATVDGTLVRVTILEQRLNTTQGRK